ncbi:MAG: RNA methyltransferase [Maribacter sp.]|nr:RNA methyltransferase [Maribacter sp.]
MDSYKQISSLQNPLVKSLLLLKEKSRERKKTGLFLIEGLREIGMAIKGNMGLETILFFPDLISYDQILNLTKISGVGPDFIEISKEVYQKLAHRETTEGVLAIARSRTHALDALVFKTTNPLILVAESPEKPGNIGALFRTADAANIDAVIIANAKGDLYNPNSIRASIGCLFTNQIAVGSTSEVIAFLRKKKISIFCASLMASKNYLDVDYRKAAAIVVGAESIGLSEEWLAASNQNIVIPMEGEIDSMNVSVSAAILIFEAKRQRRIS